MSSAHGRHVCRVRHEPNAAAKGPEARTNKKIKVVDPSIIYVKDATGTTLVELDVELTVD